MRRHPHQAHASAGGIEAAPHAGVVDRLSRAPGEHQRVLRRCDLLVKVSGDPRKQSPRQGDVPNLVGLGRPERELPVHFSQALSDDQLAAEHVDVSAAQREGFPDP